MIIYGQLYIVIYYIIIWNQIYDLNNYTEIVKELIYIYIYKSIFYIIKR